MWQLVADNIYTHRKRKVQHEDDIMICQCREPTYGGEGCGANCLNQLLNIECVPVRQAYALPAPCHNTLSDGIHKTLVACQCAQLEGFRFSKPTCNACHNKPPSTSEVLEGH